MALVVELGTGSATAESLASVADFKTYSDNFGFSYAAFTDTQLEQFLRQGTRYLEMQFRLRWKGVRTTTVQVLSWPRAGVVPEIGNSGATTRGYYGRYVVDPNTIPPEVKYACIIMAQKASAGDLYADRTQVAEQETIGPITVKYAPGSEQRTQYDSVTALLAPFLSSVGGVSVGLVKG